MRAGTTGTVTLDRDEELKCKHPVNCQFTFGIYSPLPMGEGETITLPCHFIGSYRGEQLKLHGIKIQFERQEIL